MNNSNVNLASSELEKMQARVEEILRSFGIQVDGIRTIVGPTVTLYEIALSNGMKLSEIKDLDEDIALHLGVPTVRITTLQQRQMTIGIEVPNAQPTIVTTKSVLSSSQFQNSEMMLPLALGVTSTNEPFVVDLTQIPHLLISGATGQGKTVCLHTIIASLLHKKNSDELKLVLMDPKGLEFHLYSSFASSYMLPINGEEKPSIISEQEDIIQTLHNLCLLMDKRFDILSKAGANDIREYNEKYTTNLLRPTDGYEYMPYIVVIIDEFADVITLSGEDFETPLTRLTTVARNVGIHVIISTQRPSKYVITGLIKVNFPGRISFRTYSATDSMIVLDAPGAEDLVGHGDMLYSQGGNITRIQCAYIDESDLENINSL